MFYNGSGYFKGGMHWFWWILMMALIGVVVLYGWGRPERTVPTLR